MDNNRRFSFKRKSNVKPNSDERSSSGKKKSKPFKRIRGLLTGESRRERKARKEALKAASKTSPSNATGIVTNDSADDEETIYGVNVDAPSVAMTSASDAKDSTSLDKVKKKTKKEQAPPPPPPAPAALAPPAPSSSLQVILLLLDPVTRRFELLQLEFDSLKAVVKDVLAQIPQSVTEEALAKQEYTSICDTKGTELINATKLSDFCRQSEILVAVPRGLAAQECARLAKPILTDENVIQMLQQSGIDTSFINSIQESFQSPVKEKTRATPEVSKTSPAPVKKSGKTFSWFFSFLMIALLGVGVHFGHQYVTTPLEPGQKLFPGLFKSKCGLRTVLPECDDEILWMGFNGVLSMIGSSGDVQWKMMGASCREDTEACKKGLEFMEDGTLFIGGERVKTVSTFEKDANLSPWPFTQAPNVRPVREKK